MAKLSAPHWDEMNGVCTLHMLPMVPCPQCAAEQNPEVEVHFNEMDLDIAASEKIPLGDLLPQNFSYIAKQDENFALDDEAFAEGVAEFLVHLAGAEDRGDLSKEEANALRSRYGLDRFNE